jgi:transcriptional regulator of acetoin/glycerol metabolism
MARHRSLGLCGGGPIDIAHLPEGLVEAPEPQPVRELTPEEAKHRDDLVLLLREHGGNLSAVARVFQKGRTQVMRWVALYGIDVKPLRM